MTTITLKERGDGSVAIEPSGPAGATDAAKALAEQTRHMMRAFGLHGQNPMPIGVTDRYGNMLDVRSTDGRRFVIIVAELPS